MVLVRFVHVKEIQEIHENYKYLWWATNSIMINVSRPLSSKMICYTLHSHYTHTVNFDAFAASANVSHYYYMYTKLLLNVYISVMVSTDTACNLKIFFLTNN